MTQRIFRAKENLRTTIQIIYRSRTPRPNSAPILAFAKMIVPPQNTSILDEHSEPQPDIVVLHRRKDYFRYAHPRPSDAYFVVEVSDTSIDFDRLVKAPIYARNGIVEMWIVDLVGEGIIVLRDPSSTGYRTMQTFGRGEIVIPLAFPDCTLAVSDILG